eukprot:TRINITY_DN1234_c0_g1_i1.p1 TRINITY_DN1234_c0_g1~~TRINITY_DN1234_c0_g1_i1.p1  ORF type:complete len:206 (+),score=42.58 TRINITY_DN1234_c0_g1_i1:247-864(+)
MSSSASSRTTIAQALKRFEEKALTPASSAEEVLLYGQIPPIEKMDASLGVLTRCKKLSLSTNAIAQISNLQGLRIEILSLGRNMIKSLVPLEAIAGTLTQLWISYNQIERLAGITVCKRLKTLYMSNNKVKEWSEFEKLAELPELSDLLFSGNPLEDRLSKEGRWKMDVINLLPQLRRLDGKMITDIDPLPQPSTETDEKPTAAT